MRPKPLIASLMDIFLSPPYENCEIIIDKRKIRGKGNNPFGKKLLIYLFPVLMFIEHFRETKLLGKFDSFE